MQILNLYACLGGNRYKWDEVAEKAGIKIKITAVELDSELAKLYNERFPKDEIIITDAHKFLLNNFQKFDFIWSSPPCPTHIRSRFWSSKGETTKRKPVYADMKLYEEIILLHNYFKGKYCIENVIPYYEPLIQAKKRKPHLYWTNFNLPENLSDRNFIIRNTKNEFKELCKFHNYDFTKYKGNQRTLKIARNLVDYEAGKTIFATALNVKIHENIRQKSLF